MTADLAALAGLARSLAVYYGQPWKARRLARFHAGLVKPGDLVFDVGAHVGNRTRILHRLGCRVVALEPQPLFHEFLRRTLPSGVILRAEAVGRAEGRTMLAMSRRHPTVSSLEPGWIEQVSRDPGFAGVAWDRRVEVAVTTLDRLIAEHGRPAFVKIDVEGHEAAVLDGLSVPLPLVAVEYLPAALETAFACIDRLEGLGPVRFARVEGERAAFIEGWCSGDAMKRQLEATGNGRSGDLYARSA